MTSQDLQIILRMKDELTGPLKNVSGALGGLGNAASAAGKALAVGMAAGVGAATASIVLGVKAAGDLQQAVANISTIKPEIDTSQVFSQLNEISTRVPQSAKELADGVYNIFSSLDVSQEQAIGLVETFAKGAVGANTDASTFGTAAIGVMNAYGLAAEDAGHISDVFFNTINKGVVTGPELAQGLGLVTQSAKLAGVGLDDLGGFIAGITKEGGPAAQNINNLSNLFQKITTKDAQSAFHDLGIATQDATGSFRPQIDVLTDLKTATDNMTDAGKAAAIQKIFPDLQARAGASVIIDQLAFVRDAIEANKTEAGSAASAYEKMSATFNSQSKLLANTVTSILTTIGAELLPAITPIITAFAQGLPGAMTTARAAIGGFGDGLKEQIGGGLQGVADALAATGAAWAPWAAKAGPAGDAVSASLSGVSGVVQSLQLLLQGNFQGAWKTAGEAMAAFSAAADSVRAAFDQLLPQVARDEIWKNLGEEIAALSEAFGILGEAFGEIGDAMDAGGQSGSTFVTVLIGLSVVGKGMALVIREIAVVIRDTITVFLAIAVAIDNFGASMDRIEAAIANLILQGFVALVAAVQQASQTLREFAAIAGIAFDALGTSARAGLDQLEASVGTFFDGLGTTVQSGLAAIQGFFIDTWSAIPEDIRGYLAEVAGLIVQDLAAWLASVASGMADIAGAIGTAFSDLGSTVHAGWDEIVSETSTDVAALNSLIQAGWDTLTTAAQAAWTAVSSAVSEGLAPALATVSGWVAQVIDFVRGMAGELGRAGAIAGQAAVDGLTGALRNGIRAIGDAAAAAARAALESAREALGAHSPSTEFAELGGDAVDGLIVGLKSKDPAVKAAAVELARQAQIAIQTAAPVDSFIVAGQDMGDGIALGLLRGVDKAKTAAGTYGDSILGELQSFTRNVAAEIQQTTNKLSDIGAAAVKAIQTALDKESDSIDSAVARARASIDSLTSSTVQSAGDSGRKAALGAQIAQETLAHDQVAAAEEQAYQHSQDLAKAAAKFNADLSAATTAAKRLDLQQQYADQVASINASYADAVDASKHRQDLDAASRAFRAAEDAKTKALDDQLAGEALARQISTIIVTQAAQTAAAQTSYNDAVATAQLTADSQRLILLRSYDQRIEDLKSAFLDKIPPLEGPALDAFNAFMENITAQTAAMATTVADSLGTVTTAAQQTFSDGAVPDALAITDKAVEEFADKWGTSWDDARRTLEAGARAATEQLGPGGKLPSALQSAANSARQTLGSGGIIATAAKQAAEVLDSVGQAAGDPIIGPLNLLKDAAAKLGSGGLAVAAQAAMDLESQFPGLTDAVNAWIATLGGIPKIITTDIVTNFVTNGSPAGAGGGGGGGGGGGSSSSQYAGQGSPGSYTLPNVVTGGTITVTGSNLTDAINNAAKATGVSSGAQAAGGTFGSNTNPSLGQFDTGGWLMPGMTMAYNGTGRPERILGPGEGGGNTIVNVYVQGSVQTEQDLAQSIRQQLIKIGQRNGGVVGLA